MLYLFVALAILLVLTVLILIFYPRLRKAKYQKDFVSICGKKIYKYVYKNDYYLINKLELKESDNHILKVDHLLFANKYIYLIKDYHLPGELIAKESDNSFIYIPSDKNLDKRYIDNLLIKNKKQVHRVARCIGLDESLFISIVILSDDTQLDDFKSSSNDNFIVHLSRFNRLIDKIESRNVKPLNDNQLKYTVKDVAKLNLRNNEK